MVARNANRFLNGSDKIVTVAAMSASSVSTSGYAEVPAAEVPAALDRRHDPVETMWSFRADADRTFLVLPDGRADVILRFRFTPNGGCEDVVPIVTGPSSKAHAVPVRAGDGFVGMRMRPGRSLLRGRAADLRDRRLVGGEALERIGARVPAPQRTDGVRRLKGVLTELADRTRVIEVPDLDGALDLLHLAGGRSAVEELASSTAIDVRRLHRMFTMRVGLTPQLYAAVLRFQRAVRLRKRGLTPSQTAHEAGYADQAHMTRAFRHHGGFTPARMPDIALGWMPIQ